MSSSLLCFLYRFPGSHRCRQVPPHWANAPYRSESVQFSCSVMSDSLCPMDCSMPGFPVHHQHIKLTQTHVIESVMPSNHLILCCPVLFPPSIFPSISVFSNEIGLFIRWPKYWNFSFNISPSNEHSGMISFRMDWLDLLAVQRTLQSLL